MLARIAPRHQAALALGLLWVIFFGAHALSDGVPYYRDNLLTYLPIKAYLAERLRAGELPRWYPYESLGVPFIGQVVTATFHPQSLLSLFLSAATALKANVLGAYLVALIGGYRLGRELGCSRPAAVSGACALAFSGYALGMSNNLPYLVGLATLPWVCAAALRCARRARLADAAGLGCAWALVFLCGDAQSFALCPLLLLAALAVHGVRLRSVLAMAGAGALASALCCAELLPALALSPATLRGFGAPSATLGLSWALHPLRLPELFLPGYVPDTQRFRIVGALLGGGTALWSSSIFAGGLALLFAAAALAKRDRRAIAFAAVGALALWLALGDRALLLPLLWKLVPLFSKFRFPEKYLALFFLCLSALVALGCDAVRAMPVRHSRWALRAALGAGALALVVWLGDPVGRLFSARGHAAEAALARDDVRAAWLLGLATTAALLVACVALLRLGARRAWALAALPALLFAELWHGNGNQLPLVPRAVLAEQNPFLDVLRAAARPGEPAPRLVALSRPAFHSTVTLGDGEQWVRGMRLVLRPDLAGQEHLSSFGLNLPGTSVRDFLAFGPRAEDAARFGGALHACFRVADLAAPPLPGDEPILRSDSYAVRLVRQPCAPAAYFADALPVKGIDEARARLFAGLAPFQVTWEGTRSWSRASGSIEWREASPERLRLRAVPGSAAAMVITESFAPGWEAFVDGTPAPILAVNLVARGLELPAGAHEVELRYRTPRLAAGLAVSGAALVLAVAIFAAHAVSSRRRLPPAPA